MFRSSLGRDVFLRSGLTCTCLKSSGNIPEHSDAFIIFVIGLINKSRHAFNSVVGNGSRSHDLFWRGHNYFPHLLNSSRCESN